MPETGQFSFTHPADRILAGLAPRVGAQPGPLQHLDRTVLTNLAIHDEDIANWAAYVGRLIPRRATSTTRPTAPVAGETQIFETDTGATLMYYGPTTGWQPAPWNVPWGIQAHDTQDTNQTTSGTTEKLLITGTTVTLVTNRLYWVEARIRTWATNAAAGIGEALGLRIKSGATIWWETVGDAVQQNLGAGQPPPGRLLTTRATGSPYDAKVVAAGSHSPTLNGVRLAGTGTFTIYGDGGYPMQLMIQDVGADGPPVLT